MLYPPWARPALGPPKRSARERALAAFRGVDLGPIERIRQRPARPVGQVLPEILQRLRLEKRQAETEILRVWAHLLDPTITAHAQPVGFNRGTLFIVVDSNVWLSEILRYRRKEILERLQHSFGREVICRLSFRVG